MRSIFSSNNMPRWAQAALVAICIGLSAIYFTEPLRQTPATGLREWLERLGPILGISRGNTDILLGPALEMAAGAQSLIDYRDLQFAGCDLALRRSVVELVTYWQGDVSATGRNLRLRFVLSEPDVIADAMQPIDAAVLFTPLPTNFYAADRRGQIWLKVVDSIGDRPVPVNMSLSPPDRDGWIRICNG